MDSAILKNEQPYTEMTQFSWSNEVKTEAATPGTSREVPIGHKFTATTLNPVRGRGVRWQVQSKHFGNFPIMVDGTAAKQDRPDGPWTLEGYVANDAYDNRHSTI